MFHRSPPLTSAKELMGCFVLFLAAGLLAGCGDTAGKNSVLLKDSTPGPDTGSVNSLISTARTFVERPGNRNDDLDSAILFLDSAALLSRNAGFENDSGERLTVLSQVYREKGDRPRGEEHARQSVARLRNNNQLKEKEADALIELSNYLELDPDNQLSEKINLYDTAVTRLRESARFTLKNADALKYLGDLCQLKGDYPKSLGYLKESIHIYNSIGYKRLQDIYCLMGYVQLRNFELEGAQENLLMARKLALADGDSSSTTTSIFNRLGLLYYQLEKFDDAFDNFHQAIFYGKKNNSAEMPIMVSNIGISYIKLGMYDKAIEVLKDGLNSFPGADSTSLLELNGFILRAYVESKRFAAARPYYDEVRRLIVIDRGSIGFSISHQLTIIEYYIGTHQLDKIPAGISRINQILAANPYPNFRIRNERILYEYDSARGNLPSALEHYKNFKIQTDSINLQTRKRQIAQLEVQYKVKEKDIQLASKAKDLINLNTQTELQRKAFNSEHRSRNMAIAGMVLISLLLFLLYNRYRLKQKTTRAINKQNEELKELVTEKEWLFREMQHRTKNSLQIVMSLLEAQRPFLSDDKTRDLIRESSQRIHSISLIHEKLYQAEDLCTISMTDYINELVEYIKGSFLIGNRIRFSLQVSPIELDLSQAILVGLIINEAVTNSVKYAFSDKHENPGISITASREENDQVSILVSDNGVGLPEGFDIGSSRSLGLKLMDGLAKQLSARIRFENNNGLHIFLDFRIKEIIPKGLSPVRRNRTIGV